LGPNLRGKVAIAPPGRAKVQFFKGNWGDLDGGVVNLVVLASVLRRMTKKLFGEEKCTDRENPGYMFSVCGAHAKCF